MLNTLLFPRDSGAVENKTEPLDECVWTFINRMPRSSSVFTEKAQTLERNAVTDLNARDVWRKQEATNRSVSLFFLFEIYHRQAVKNLCETEACTGECVNRFSQVTLVCSQSGVTGSPGRVPSFFLSWKASTDD